MGRIFLLNRPLTYFRGQTDCLVCLGAKLLRFISPRKPPKSFFQKTRFRSEFFPYSAPHNLSGPNGLYGAIGGKIVPEGSFVSLKKHVYALNFLLNRPFPYFRGQTDCLVCLEAKLFHTKTSLHLASEATEIVFPKNTFSVRIFFLQRTSQTIGAKRTIWRDWGRNCSGVKFHISEKTRLWSEFFY